jgi:hypothetical protein
VIVASNIAMQFGAKPLFADVAVKFGGGNRYPRPASARFSSRLSTRTSGQSIRK